MPEDGNAPIDIPGTAPVVPRRYLYPVEDVAVLVGVTARKVRGLLDEKRLGSRYLDGRRLVPDHELKAFIDALPTEPVREHPRRKQRLAREQAAVGSAA